MCEFYLCILTGLFAVHCFVDCFYSSKIEQEHQKTLEKYNDLRVENARLKAKGGDK